MRNLANFLSSSHFLKEFVEHLLFLKVCSSKLLFLRFAVCQSFCFSKSVPQCLFLKVSVPHCPIVTPGGTLGKGKNVMTGERAVGGTGPGAAQGKTGKGEEHLFRGPRLPPTHPHTGETAAGRKGIKTLHFH